MKDIEIRKLLKATILQEYIEDKESRVVDELPIPIAHARADVAVINGHMHGFEIKGASDSLVRIPHQITAYNYVFDYSSVVTEDKYVLKLKSILPVNVGLYICKENAIKCIRKPKLNKKLNGFHLAKLLWREELTYLLKENNIHFSTRDRNWLLCELLENELPVNIISESVRHLLKQRTNWKVKAGYEEM